MNNLAFDECRSRANDALSTLEGYSITKEDLERCLKDWYDRGNNYCLGMRSVIILCYKYFKDNIDIKSIK